MLTLPIKGKWFHMIETGEKPEEYRNITPYYRSRFKKIFGMFAYSGIPVGTDKHTIRLRNGYSKTSPTLEVVCSLDIGTGREEWGAEPGVEYYILKIYEKRRIM